MRKKIVIILIASLTIIVFLWTALDAKEKYVIDRVEYGLFEVESIDTLSNLCILKSKFVVVDTSKNYLLGVRIGIEWVSVKREGIRLLWRKGSLDEGPADKIKDLNLTIKGIDKKSIMSSPFTLQYFKVADSNIVSHTVVHNKRDFLKQQRKSITAFIEEYNSAKRKGKQLTDFMFFEVSSKEIIGLDKNDIKISVINNNGKVIWAVSS